MKNSIFVFFKKSEKPSILDDYCIKYSKRKTLAIQINHEGEVIIKAPKGCNISFIEKIILKKQSWIQKQQTKIFERNRTKPHKLSEEILENKKNILKKYIEKRTHEIWKTTNLPPYTSIKITKSYKRWGSCSEKNGLCFSYRLAEYLEFDTNFIDAIIVHELCHLQEKNHQKPFWNLVYSLMENYEDIMRKYS